MLGSLLPSAASAALAAAEDQHGDPTGAMQQLLQLQAGGGSSMEAEREWADAVLEPLRAQSDIPGQDGLPLFGTEMLPALAQLYPPPVHPGSPDSKCDHSSIYHSFFATCSRTAGNHPPAAKDPAASLMPALPTPQPLMSPGMHMPNIKGLLANIRSRAMLAGVTALHHGDDQDAPVCFSGESKDSHVERATPHRSDGHEMTEADQERMRLKRTQEKNRRNQRKFRARQRAKLEDSELQVKELSRQVMALERAKAELDARNRQLESVVHGGEDTPRSLAAPGISSQNASDPKDGAACFKSLSFIMSKVCGEHISCEQACDMLCKDTTKNMEMYHGVLSRWFEEKAVNAETSVYAELAELLALKLTPEQKERLLAMRAYLLAQMMEIIQERTLIVAMRRVQSSSPTQVLGVPVSGNLSQTWKPAAPLLGAARHTTDGGWLPSVSDVAGEAPIQAGHGVNKCSPMYTMSSDALCEFGSSAPCEPFTLSDIELELPDLESSPEDSGYAQANFTDMVREVGLVPNGETHTSNMTA